MCTVQAPHCAMPHPNFVPVSFKCSRITQSNGVSASAVTSIDFPLTVSIVMLFLPLKHFPSRQRFDHEGRSPIVIRTPFSSAAEPPLNPDARDIGLSLHQWSAATR